MGKANYKELKDELASVGRDPSSVQICPAVYVIVGETAAIAQQKRAVAEATMRDDDGRLLAKGTQTAVPVG